MQQQPKAYILLFLAIIIWGFSFIWSKSLFAYLGVLQVVAIRYSLAAGFSVYVFWWKRIRWRDIPYFMLLASLEPFAYSFFEIKGIEYSGASITAIMVSIIPLVMILIGAFFLKEKLTKINILGIVLSFFGVLVILYNGTDTFWASDNFTGILYLLGAVLSASVGGFVLKRLTQRYAIATIIGWQNILSGVFYVPVLLWKGVPVSTMTHYFSEIWLPFLLLSVGASVLAFAFYANAVKFIGLVKTNAVTYLIPVITLLAAWYLFAEPLTLQKGIGTLVVIGGLYLSQKL
jgi:drug/metabolite transporter (DMT)-like permease